MMSESIRRCILSVACAAVVFPSLAGAQQFKDTFPRIGAYEIGSGLKISHPDYRQNLAKNDILIVGLWREWALNDDITGELLSIRDVVVDIKRRAAAMGNDGIKIANYTIINESSSNPDNTATRKNWDKLHSEIGPGYPVNNDWYARTSVGEHTSSWAGTWHANVTEHVQRDRNGDTYPEWAVQTNYEDFFRDIPEFDMWFVDNWFYRPRVTADWDGDGTNDSRNSEQVRTEFRRGYLNALDRIQELAPNLVVMGNVDGDAESNGMLTEPEYRGQIAALYEGAIGSSYSVETWGGWDRMMYQYRTTLDNAKHNLILVTVHGGENDYATMRYGLASCLMDNGYYYYTSDENEYKSNLWFDEYDVALGRAIDPPQFSAWQKGIYMRRFENGMALVNPKGNGTQTIRIESGYERVAGKQDPSTNNGQAVETVTLSERDGLILIKTDATKDEDRPKPPVLSIVLD